VMDACETAERERGAEEKEREVGRKESEEGRKEREEGRKEIEEGRRIFDTIPSMHTDSLRPHTQTASGLIHK
jgi:hypothetical protein